MFCWLGEFNHNVVRLVHPFSPRGKLIHFGIPALDNSNRLIQMASNHQPQCILRHHLYRVALSTKNAIQLQQTAESYPDLATWISKEDMNNNFGIEDSFGGVELGNGCKVIHVPSYLRGLWEECETKADEKNGSIKWELIQMPNEQQDTVGGSFNQQLAQYDAVILSAGAGIIYDQLISKGDELPVQLVRGQSIEMIMPKVEEYPVSNEAFLCGKYISPLPQSNTQQNRFVIGATHEFKADELSPFEVMDELKSRTYPLARRLWDHGDVDRLTTGVRMQSNRGSFGMYLFVCQTCSTSCLPSDSVTSFTLIFNAQGGCP